MTVINIETVPERKTANKAPGKTKSEEKTTKGVSLSDNSDDQDKVPLLHYGDDQWEARKELYQKVWEKPVTEVAKEYHISDVALRKRCNNLDVPLPERGYWAKLKAGKSVHKTKLTKITASFPKPHTGEKHKLRVDASALSFMKREGRQEILSLASILSVGGPGSKMVKEVEKLQNTYKEWHKPDKDIRTPGDYRIPRRRESSYAPLFANEFSPKVSSRAFHLLDALTRALLPNCGTISCYRGYDSVNHYFFIVNNDRVAFTLSELKDNVIHETTQDEFMEMLKYKEDKRRGRYAIEPQIPKYDHPWSGKLKMTIADSAEFIDCKTYVLEDRIGEILVALYEASYPSRLQRIQEEELLRQEIERLDKEIEEDKRREQIRDKYNSEVSKTKALINKATDYETACSIRKLIGAVKKDPNNPDNNPEWIDWANKKADWFDPTIAREDELFGIREHDLDPDQKALKER